MRFWIILLSFISLNLCAETLIYEADKKGIKLTEKDKEALEIGEISNARYIIGGVLGTYPIGLGLGHAVQGRWSEKGWIFTTGELASVGVVIIGAAGCLNNEADNGFNGKSDCSDFNSFLVISGIIGYVGFRIWEAVDVWVAPIGHNKKVRELKNYINKEPMPTVKSSLNLVPLMSPSMGQGVGLKYIF